MEDKYLKDENQKKFYFKSVEVHGAAIIKFIDGLKKSPEFDNSISNLDFIKKLLLVMKSTENIIQFLFLLDLIKYFKLFADIKDTNNKQAIFLRYIIAKSNFARIDCYEDIISLDVQPVILSLEGLEKEVSENFEVKTNNSNFRLSSVLSYYNLEVQKEYISLLFKLGLTTIGFIKMTIGSPEYSIISEIHQAELTAIIKEKTKQRQNLFVGIKPKVPLQKQGDTKDSVPTNKQSKNLDEIVNELNSMIGLAEVKKEINTLINFIRIQKAREASGLKSSNISYHIVFTGNPGTGKTTVARIVAEIYKALGILSQGQVIETDRSGVIAEYVGQTAIKVNTLVNSAINGVLFIDEAYSIAGDGQNDFGKEAIAALIKRMEDDRDKLVVIMAGYKNEMADFIETNPGFKSRFNRYIEFADYLPNELFAIFESQCKKLEYQLTDEARLKLETIFETAYNNRDKSFGNGRYVRNVFEKVLEIQANRISKFSTLDRELLTTITLEDIP